LDQEKESRENNRQDDKINKSESLVFSQDYRMNRIKKCPVTSFNPVNPVILAENDRTATTAHVSSSGSFVFFVPPW
jgi:4-diphosphocytidyl-2C-methyl-D-erythritol kinase